MTEKNRLLGFEITGVQTPAERTAEARRKAEAEGKVMEIDDDDTEIQPTPPTEEELEAIKETCESKWDSEIKAWGILLTSHHSTIAVIAQDLASALV